MDLDTNKGLGRHEFGTQVEELPVSGEDGDLGGRYSWHRRMLHSSTTNRAYVLVLVAFAFLDFLFRKGVFYKEKVGRDPWKKKTH